MFKRVEIQGPSAPMWMVIAEGPASEAKVRQWSETKVWTSPGSTHVSSHTSVSTFDPNISHTTTTVERMPDEVHSRTVDRKETEFWVLPPEGGEYHVAISDQSFPVRTGQRIRLAWGANLKKDRGYNLLCRNLETGQLQILWYRNLYYWAVSEGIFRYPFPYHLITVWIPRLIALLTFLVFVLAVTVDKGIPGLNPLQCFQDRQLSCLATFWNAWLGYLNSGDALKYFSSGEAFRQFEYEFHRDPGNVVVPIIAPVIVLGISKLLTFIPAYLLFGHWYKVAVMNSFYKRVLAAFDSA